MEAVVFAAAINTDRVAIVGWLQQPYRVARVRKPIFTEQVSKGEGQMAAESDLQVTPTDAQRNLAAEIQSHGLKLESPGEAAPSRKGGAGPSDHRTVTVNGQTIMAPVLTHSAQRSPLVGRPAPDGKSAVVYRNGEKVGLVTFPPRPRFYDLETAEGIPYWKIAQLHSTDVLATTVLQHCIRYPDVKTRCQ